MNQKRLPVRAFTLVELPAGSRSKRIAFTLVELLVVIGIIALLISVLLPTLAGARRAAQAAKCGASLRSIGQALQLYSIDNHGYAPPWRAGNASGVAGNPGGIYNLYGIAYNSPSNIEGSAATDACFWFDFLAKYLTKSHGGSGDSTSTGQHAAQSSVIWGCPAWQGFPDTSGTAAVTAGGAGLNRQYVGYSYNYQPDIGVGFKTTVKQGNFYYGQYSSDIRSADNFSSSNWTSSNGQSPRWFKLTDYRPASEKAISGDSFNWKLETQPWNGGGSFPPQQTALTIANSNPVYAAKQAPGTTFDLFRHGAYPALTSNGNFSYFKSSGGKMSYNILFADGHVIKSAERGDAYRAEWGQYPVTYPIAGFSNPLSD